MAKSTKKMPPPPPPKKKVKTAKKPITKKKTKSAKKPAKKQEGVKGLFRKKVKENKKQKSPPKKQSVGSEEPKKRLSKKEKERMAKKAKRAKRLYIEGRTIILKANKLTYKSRKSEGFPGLESPDYWSWSLTELKGLAKELGIKGYARMSQETLIHSLKHYQLLAEKKYLQK